MYSGYQIICPIKRTEARLPRCAHCGEPIESEYYLDLGQLLPDTKLCDWCVECFTKFNDFCEA